MKFWLVPNPVRGSRHEFKYSLFYERPGERLILYDNEPGKGDYRHYREREEPYTFTTPEELIEHFLADLERLASGHGFEGENEF